MKRYQFTAELTREATVVVEAEDATQAMLNFYDGEYEILEEHGIINTQIWGKGKEVA